MLLAFQRPLSRRCGGQCLTRTKHNYSSVPGSNAGDVDLVSASFQADVMANA